MMVEKVGSWAAQQVGLEKLCFYRGPNVERARASPDFVERGLVEDILK